MNFRKGNRYNRDRTVGVFGLPGVGKTSLAKKYSEIAKTADGTDTLWLDAGKENEVRGSLVRSLNLSSRVKKQSSLIDLFKQILKEKKELGNRQLLVVIDNLLGSYSC